MFSVILTAVILAIFLFLALRRLEQTSLYFPDADVMADPAGIGLQFENVEFKAQDGTRLHGWYVPRPNSRAVVLYAHGNGGNIAYRFDTIEWFHDMGVDLFLFDWRGYGKSEGKPSEKGLYQDARAAWTYLTEVKKIPPSKIFIFGESLGAAPAIQLALEVPAAGLITEGAFASTRAMAKATFPFLPTPFLPIRDQYDNLSKIAQLRLPKLIAHGEVDDIVPFQQGEEIFKAAAEPKKFLRLDGDHNSARFQSGKNYEEELRKFFKANLN